MVHMTDNGTGGKGDIVVWLLWTAMVLSLFVYVLVCQMAGDEIQKSVHQDVPVNLLKNIFFGVSAFVILLAFIIRRAMLPGIDSHLRTMSMRNKPLQIGPNIRGRYMVAMLISLALSETVAIFGLVLFFLGDTLQTLYIFVAISFFAMLFHRPKSAELEGFAMALERKEKEQQYR